MHDHERATLGIEPAQGLVELIPISDRAGKVAVRADLDGFDIDLDGASPTTPGDPETGMDGQAVEPRIEAVRVAQPRQAAPRLDKRFLDSIAGKLRVVQDQASGAAQPTDGCACQDGERVMVAMLGLLNEDRLIHSDPSSVRWSFAAVTGYGSAEAPIVP